MLTDAIMAQITKRHQGPSMTRARFDEGFQCLHEVLTPFVNSAGWLHYVEKPEQPVKAPILIAHKALLRPYLGYILIVPYPTLPCPGGRP